MKHIRPFHRNFLFLQGPPGPFFWQLSQRLDELGHESARINLNGGDQRDWPGPATNYRGSRRRWALFIDRYLRDNAITDLILFGDCRPLHIAAHRMAKLRKINVHVFEEGYIRPDWLTLEPSGVNGHSSLPDDIQWYVDEAARLKDPEVLPRITASFGRRARDCLAYYGSVVLMRPLYPWYQSHRRSSLVLEGLGWLRKLATARPRAARTERILSLVNDRPYFLFPLQLSNDFQIRAHSPFANMREAADYVLQSFATRAPKDMMLLIKEHPLDASFRSWSRYMAKIARRHGIADRVVTVDGGELRDLAVAARGVVTVNSTSGTLSLAANVPTIALGTAVYDMPGITHQGRLDDFWQRPQAPSPGAWTAFYKVLHDRCLVYGGIASESATRTLVESSVRRLAGESVLAEKFASHQRNPAGVEPRIRLD